MSQRIPSDAFDFYIGLGPTRSYQSVADRYGVSKRAVVKHAVREKWTERVAEIHREAREENDKKAVQELGDMHDRHAKMLKAMAVRALTGIKEFPLRSGMEAIRAAELVIKLERIIHGEPTERGEVSIEEITKREIETLLIRDDEPDGWDLEERAEADNDPPPPAPGAPPPRDEDPPVPAPGGNQPWSIVYEPDPE